MTGAALARRILARGSKSFALAGKLLPRAVRDDAAVVYAWCRRADDAIDLAPPQAHALALAGLRSELEGIYGGRPQADPVLAAFQEVVRRRGISWRWPAELLDGMAMDAEGRRYRTLDDLLLYCFRVAGTVGLMMAELMQVRDRAALRRAADLGIAMQLTNVCRDVAEDAARGRVYLPEELRGGAVRALLAAAEGFYRSGDAGLPALPWRCAIAIRTARLCYAAIGDEIARRGFDPGAGRAVVPLRRKLALAARALVEGLLDLPRRWRRRPAPATPAPRPLPFPLPLEEPRREEGAA